LISSCGTRHMVAMGVGNVLLFTVLATFWSGTSALSQPTPTRHAFSNRRIALSSAAAATAAFGVRAVWADEDVVPGKQIQGLGQFVKLLEGGRAGKDVDKIRVALSSLKLASDEEAVSRVINHAGTAAGHTATATYRTAVTSTKVTVTIDGAAMKPDDYIKLMWIKDAESGQVIAVRDLAKAKLSEAPTMLASIPKSSGRTLVPCVYCVPYGVFDGQPFKVE